MRTQIRVRTDNLKLTKNFGTGDIMLRYKGMIIVFFIDNFFETNKSTCCQLFFTDEFFFYVVPMKSNGEVI